MSSVLYESTSGGLLYVPSARYVIRANNYYSSKLTVPFQVWTPNLLFVRSGDVTMYGSAVHVYVVDRYPTSLDDKIYQLPWPSINHGNGSGNVRALCGKGPRSTTLKGIVNDFFTTKFQYFPEKESTQFPTKLGFSFSRNNGYRPGARLFFEQWEKCSRATILGLDYYPEGSLRTNRWTQWLREVEHKISFRQAKVKRVVA